MYQKCAPLNWNANMIMWYQNDPFPLIDNSINWDMTSLSILPPTFSASGARYTPSASRSSDTGNHCLLPLTLTGNPAAWLISRKSSRLISARAPPSQSTPLMAASLRKRWRSAASRVIHPNIAGNHVRATLHFLSRSKYTILFLFTNHWFKRNQCLCTFKSKFHAKSQWHPLSNRYLSWCQPLSLQWLKHSWVWQHVFANSEHVVKHIKRLIPVAHVDHTTCHQTNSCLLSIRR